MILLLSALLVLTTVTVNAYVTSENVNLAWEDFKLNHGKQYKSLHEEVVRKAIFIDNYNTIVEHNKLFAQGLATFSMNANEFSDMSNEEFRNTFNGYKKSKISLSSVDIVQFVPEEGIEIPDEVDWRDAGAVTPVKNQARCGSCWAFSATGALEGQHFLKTGELVSISEQNLIDCSHEHNNIGCAGGDMSPAFAYVYSNGGIDSEESYPYEAKDGACRYTVSANVSSAKGYATIENGNEEYLRAAVATIGPIAVGIDANHLSFQLYRRGVYYQSTCSSGSIDPENELNHGVLVVGYGSENGVDYWLVKNSWGPTWGDKGYIRMARNRQNNCGIAADASFPLNY